MSIVKWFKDLKFQGKLVIGYLVLALIPMLCVTWYTYFNIRSMLLEQSYDNVNNEVEKMQQNFSMLLEPCLTTLDILYIDASLSGYLSQDYSSDSYEEMFYYIDQRITGICLINPSISRIRFYSSNQTLPSDNYYFFREDALSEQERERTRKAQGTVVLNGTELQDGKMHLCLDRLMNVYPQGKTESILSLEIEQDLMSDFVTVQDETEAVYLTDSDGMILAASSPEKIGKNIAQWMPDWRTEDKIQTEFKEGGTDKIGISVASAYDSYIVMVSDKEATLKNMKSVSGQMMALIFLSAAVVMASIVLYSRWLSHKVSKVMYAARKLGDGEFDYILEDMGKDEIGQIGDAFNLLNQRIQWLIRENYEKKIKLQSEELNLMQEQINPHFLYNALAAISALALREGQGQTVKCVKYLADFYRISLNKGKQVLSIREELELLKNYLNIQKVRFGESIQVEYEVKKELLTLKTIKLLLQPLVENSIHHGRRSEEEILMIRVSIFLEGDRVCFSVEDNGNGIKQEKLEKLRGQLEQFEEGYGLKNVHNRVRFTYGEGYGVKIDSVSGVGTRVRVYIPQVF
ncbi:MAG TPA: histidine kinase [Candidatus Fusicatenibacter merdavium]|uniref:histidine kinase n=1 Tax=Candidatus Fusicatenibacter merdavium TaxID=2838600 RepID=A0A9D1XDH8_9FIRM|nr:histidine kinase [Candidatus Fusicatenibacter merdavium]